MPPPKSEFEFSLIFVEQERPEMSDPNSNNNQEVMQPNPEDLQDSVELPFALLRLNNFNSNNHQPCTTCGCSGSNPVKWRSPSPSSSFQDPLHPDPSCSEPNPKRLFFEPDDLTLCGFSKLSLPTTPASSSPRRRSVSGPPTANAFVSTPMVPFADASGSFALGDVDWLLKATKK